MRKLLIALTAVTLLLTACQKEGSFEDPNGTPGGGGGGTGGGGSNQSGLLYRSVLEDATGSDSTVQMFTYDGSKRITNINYGASSFTENIRIVRNAAGIVTDVFIKNTSLASVGIDSLAVKYNYSTAESRYKYSLYSIAATGIAFKDSTVFNYGTNGALSSKVSYASLPGTPYAPAAKSEFTVASGNITSEKYFESSSSGSWDPVYTVNYTYDAKVNPLVMGVESVLFDPFVSLFALTSAGYFGANNATVIDYVDDTDPSGNYRLSSTYMYNNTNKPVSGTAVESPGSTNYRWKFYYY